MRTPAAGETDPDSQMWPPQRDKNSKAKDAAVMKGAQPTHGTGQPQPGSRTDESAMMQGYSGAMSDYAMSMGMGAPPRRSPATSNRQKAAERLLAALESPTQADFLDIPLSDVLEFYSDLHGIAFVMGDDATIADKRINLTLREQIPLGSVLQALTDKSGIQFYVRDYGLLVQDGDQPRPEGAVSVQQFRSNPRAVDDYLSGTARGFSSGRDYYDYHPMGAINGGSTAKAPTGVRDKPKAPADEPDEKPSTATQPTDDTEPPPKASSKANPKDDLNDNPQPQK